MEHEKQNGLKEPEFMLKFSDLFVKINRATDLKVESLEKEMQRALTLDPDFLKRKILALLACSNVENEKESFKTLKSKLQTTNTRLTRCLKSLERQKVLERRIIKLFPRRSEYRLVSDETIKKGLIYWMEDQTCSWLLQQAAYLYESAHMYLKTVKDPNFTNSVKDNLEKAYNFLVEHPPSTLYINDEKPDKESWERLVKEEASKIIKCYTNPESLRIYFEEKLRIIATQTLRLLIGDIWQTSISIAANEIQGVQKLFEKARQETPMLLYSYVTLEVCNETLRLLDKNERESKNFFEECFTSLLKQPIHAYNLQNMVYKLNVQT